MAEEVATTTHLPKDQYQFKAGLRIPLVCRGINYEQDSPGLFLCGVTRCIVPG